MTHSLHGLRILNTRPKRQAQKLSQTILEAGGIPVECPTLEIRAVNPSWVQDLPDLTTVHQAIFISANAVHHCFKRLTQHNIKWPTHIEVIAIGQSSATALTKYGLLSNEIPEYPNSEHLLSLNTLKHVANQTVLLFKGEGGRSLIEEDLLRKGAKVLPQLVYKRVMPKINAELITSIWRNDRVDIILLTSEQSINNLFKMFGHEALEWIQSKPCLVISERLAKAASLFGIQEIVVSHPERMINTLFDYYQGLIHGQ